MSHIRAGFARHATIEIVVAGLTETAATRNIGHGLAARMGEKGMNRRMADSVKTAEANAGVPSIGARFLAGEMLSVSGGLHP